MPPVIYLLRHGVTVTNTQGLIAGETETDLTPQGILQAKAAGAFLKNINIKQAYCSPQARARQTFKALSLDIPVEYDSHLREMFFGNCEGKPVEFLHKTGITFKKLYTNRTVRFPNGDGYDDALGRTQSFFDEKIKAEKDPILIVTHGAIGLVLMSTILPNKIEKLWDFALGNADVIKIENGTFKVVFETEKSGKALKIRL